MFRHPHQTETAVPVIIFYVRKHLLSQIIAGVPPGSRKDAADSCKSVSQLFTEFFHGPERSQLVQLLLCQPDVIFLHFLQEMAYDIITAHQRHLSRKLLQAQHHFLHRALHPLRRTAFQTPADTQETFGLIAADGSAVLLPLSLLHVLKIQLFVGI